MMNSVMNHHQGSFETPLIQSNERQKLDHMCIVSDVKLTPSPGSTACFIGLFRAGSVAHVPMSVLLPPGRPGYPGCHGHSGHPGR